MKISKRTVDLLAPKGARCFVWDFEVSGFGLRIEASGRKTFICRYRRGGIRRQYTLGRSGVITAEQARLEARRVLGSAVLGDDPSGTRREQRAAILVRELVDEFLAGHGPKLKSRTRADYESALRRHVVPALGYLRAETVLARDLNRIHLRLADHPYRANRIITYVSSVYSWGARNGYLPKGCNPARDVKRFREEGRERYLTANELDRLGAVLRQAETQGLPWMIRASGDAAKHIPKSAAHVEVYPRHVTGAIRLLLLTGCRLREFLNLRWDEVDLERGVLLLPDSKTGRKPVVLNGAACSVLSSLTRLGRFVIPGTDTERPRHDLKRPWDHIRSAASIEDVRIHDLRHTHASIGAGEGFGLPIIGRLLGHASPMTTQRYAHLADDPVRRASEVIGNRLRDALDGTTTH